ncbi:TonB-dependent hemoglobin/transferrin/lactoferrin family receptor [Methylophaga sp. OBS1]|uniref:TonB-dependent hemoglobin/transferrin/lactoferrin family receptor n=1 Tax=Methylophaga sp. OBS1 TaxID=2991933 RepID=UPI00224C89C0|nr:TonB-dependent hemoglobin/transferrin/lactoferrin family receptor [Methylophaga sp. OBS1]MCX4192670.1 TonB-dependent hemoglobin/transferrin/lactoferrin family receptor [Methylophaga sp. OBS1]
MKYCKNYRITLLTALLAGASASVNADPLSLDKLEVSSTLAGFEYANTRHIESLEQQELDRRQAQSVPETVALLPNVSLRGGPRENLHTVNIRGLGANRVLQLIDGTRQNFESGHRPSYFLDPALLKRVEVIKGPVSSLWGSGALGGVISSETVHAADLLNGGENFAGFIKQGYNSNNDKWLTTTALAGRYGDVDLLVSGFYRDGNDIEIGGGDNLLNSAVRDRGMMAKMDWFIDPAQTATFNFRSSRVDGSVPSNGSAVPNDTSNFLIERENETDHASLDYRLNPDSHLINSKLKLYWNRTRMDESRISDDRPDDTKIRTLGINLNNRSDLGLVQLLYGIDGYQDKIDTSRGGVDRPVPPEATTDVWGAFVNMQMPLSQQWLVELGGRYDYFATEADNLNDDRSDNAFSPSAAISWLPTEDLRLTLRYDEAFRAPSAEELYTTGTHFTYGPFASNTFINDPNLDPEEAKNIELLLDYQLHDVFNSGDKVTWHASAFHNEVDNFIEQITTNYQQIFLPFDDDFYPLNTEYRNVDEAQLVGFEIAVNYQWESWNTLVSYGQTRAQNKNTGEALSHIPADKWVVDLNKAWLADSLKTGFTITRVEAQRHLPTEISTDYDHYTLVDLYANWTPRDFENLTVDLTVNNLTDQKYIVAFEQLYMPGKDIRLGVRYDF